MIDEPKTIVMANAQLSEQVKLDESFRSVETPTRMQKLQLYPHQATVVAAMLDLEDRRVLKMPNTGYENITSDEIVVETSGMVLSEPFGSGKTAEILSLILLRPVPKAFPTHLNAINIVPVVKMNWRQRRNHPNHEFTHEITRRIISSTALIRPNLIVVGSSVLVQWEQAIKEFTDLKVFSIGDFYKLQKFAQLYKERKVNAYDIILLKNGKVTGNFIVPGEDPAESNKDYRGLVSVVGKLTESACWSRVIYDDFDTIAIPTGTSAINALFTVYVSATTKQDIVKNTAPVEYATMAEAFRSCCTPLSNVVKDNVLFSNFNIKNEPEYTETSTKITKIKGFQYVYANPDDNYIRLIGAMGEDDANNIMEMLNGDAIATAAEAMGIKTKSVADIFQKMLDKKYERYLHDQYVLETIDKLRLVMRNLAPHKDGKRHSMKKLDAIRSAIIKKQLPVLKYHSESLELLIDDLYEEFQAAKQQDGMAINRVIDNIKEGMCQVCTLPLTDFDTFIVRCCGLIVCDICGIKGNQIQNRYDYKTKCTTVYGSCANCKTTIYPQKDLIFVDKNFDMDALLSAKGDEQPIEEEPIVEAVVENKEPEPEIKNPKLKALREIILGKVPQARSEISLSIKHLLEGRISIDQPEGVTKKVVVFANFNETLNLVEEFLVEHNIIFLRLGGTFQEKAKTVKKFMTYGSVLLINSQQHCAGLNIQFMTDLVYFHKITDQNIESQVAGRGQRIGRQYDLNIHYLAYKNEEKLIK